MSYRLGEGVHARDVGDELVILDSAGDRYFGLNPSGVAVWRRVTSRGSVADAERDLVEAYGIDEAAARADVSAVLEHLVSAGLLVAEEPA